MKTDIIIAGGGAAGSMAAWLASEADFDVTLLEKRDRYHYKPCSGVFPLHALKHFPKIPESWFERDHVTMRPISPKNDALLDSREFDTILGKIILRSRFDGLTLDQAEKRGAVIKENTTIRNITVKNDGVSVEARDASGNNQEVTGDVLFLATGTSGYNLHDQVGLEKPSFVESGIGEFKASETHIEEVLSSGAYHYYLNRRVSSCGPFWITCRKETFNAGIIDFKTSEQKVRSVIAHDPRIKPLFEDVKENVPEGQKKTYSKALIPSGPIKKPFNNRVLALGDAAGLPHVFYYEGVWEGRESARLAVETIKMLRDEGTQPTKENLIEYKKRLARNLVNKFLRSGRRNSWLFWKAMSDETLWYYFCDTLHKKRKFRKLLTRCFAEDYAEAKEDFDRIAGEMIFGNIPILKKMLYAPYFLKASSIK